MSFLAKHSKAIVFFVLGVLVTSAVVATTLAANAQFGRPQLTSSVSWYFQRAEPPGRAQTVIAAKCPSTERVVSGGYKLSNIGDGTQVHVLQSYPDQYENAYVVIVDNRLSSSVIAYSDVGCIKP